MCFVLSEVDQVHPILLAVEGPLLGPLLAVVDDDLVICAAGDNVHPIVAVVYVGNLVLVVIVQLGHAHRADDIVHQLHPDDEAAKSARLTWRIMTCLPDHPDIATDLRAQGAGG